MEVLHARCAGLDVHKDTVVACARLVEEEKIVQDVKTFSTTTKGLLELSDWLSEHGCTHVAMEATGVYWKPVWHVLEGEFDLVLANAAHIKNVPGRKTDVNDAMWIADLLAHGLIRGSFVPPTHIQEMRDLTRTRKQLVRERAGHVQRIQKTLEDANFKLASVLTDVLGKTGRLIIEAIIAGQTDPEAFAQLAQGLARKKHAELVEACRGRVRDHHRSMLKLHLSLIDSLDAGISELNATLGKGLEEVRSCVRLLRTIPGVSDTVAHVIVAEIGTDMGRFPTAAHLISWAGLCPRNDESAGKRRSTRLRMGNSWLKTTLVQAAWAASRKKDCYPRSQFSRLKARRGPKKAIMAVASSILTAAYHMMRDGTEYQDLGPQHFDRSDKTKTISRLVRRLQDLGCAVEVKAA
jgi:transposase